MRCFFLRYRNLISWLILNLTGLIVVFLSCDFGPLILTLMYLGFSCLALHNLLNNIAAVKLYAHSLADKLRRFYKIKMHCATIRLIINCHIVSVYYC